MNNADKATESFKKALELWEQGDLAKAAKCLRRALKLDPVPIFWSILVEVLIDMGKHSEALTAARKAERLALTKRWRKKLGKEKLGSRLALTYLSIGRIHQEAGRMKLAERNYRRSLDAGPRVFTCVFLAVLLAELGRDQEAKKYYERALALEPDYEEAHYNLGVWYRRHDKYALAEQHFRKAIAIDPKYVLALRELGTLLWRLGESRWEESAKLLRKAVRLAPDDPWNRLFLADILWCLDRNKAAEAQYREALGLDPSSGVAHSHYGQLLAEEGRDRQAEQRFRKALQLDPKDRSARYHYGRLLLDLSRTGEARKMLTRAARLGHGKAKRLLEEVRSE